MSEVIFTNHALQRVYERAGKLISEADLLLLARVAWMNRHKRHCQTARRLVHKIANVKGDGIIAEAGGYLFVFDKFKPVVITVYSL